MQLDGLLQWLRRTTKPALAVAIATVVGGILGLLAGAVALAVFGFCCGLLHGDPHRYLPLAVHGALAGTLAGALVGGFGRAFLGTELQERAALPKPTQPAGRRQALDMPAAILERQRSLSLEK